MPFWKSAWAPVWQFASAAASGSVSDAPDTNEIMVSMLDVQMVMTRCKITPEMAAILIDSMEAGKLRANLKMPEGDIEKGNFPSLLASALEDFKDKQWYAFGNQLGAAMQDLLVVSFSQKYEVGGGGSLRLHIPDMGQLATHCPLGFAVVGAMSAGFLALFAIVRGRRVVVASLSSASFGREFDRLDRAPVLLDDNDDLEAIVE